MSEVKFISEDELKYWVGSLQQHNFVYLPHIDDVWFEEIISCFKTACIVPVCRTDVFAAGARIFYKIIKNHYRIDGNKRSALICIYLFFLVNNVLLRPQPATLYSLARKVADSREKSEHLIQTLRIFFVENSKVPYFKRWTGKRDLL